MSWNAWAGSELRRIRETDRLRRLIAFDGHCTYAKVDGREVVAFASNDYLGLSHHPLIKAAAREAIERFGTGAGASRLITGTRSLHNELEAAIAQWKKCERALVYSSGYAANLGVLSALGAEGTTIFSDELNHASIIDGCRLAKAQVVVYRHGDCDHLEALMRERPGRKIVVTDAVFSMDGDVAPLSDLARLCVEYAALLILDEAHAVFDNLPAFPAIEILRVGTLSKTLGSLGGWVAGPTSLIDLLINRARTFIYTTGLSPADTGAALAAVRLLEGSEGRRLQDKLQSAISQIKPGHPSPIIPIILGTDRAALRAAETLLTDGLYVPAIRPPTVPLGTARLRVTLSAAHTDDMLGRLRRALGALSTRLATSHDAT